MCVTNINQPSTTRNNIKQQKSALCSLVHSTHAYNSERWRHPKNFNYANYIDASMPQTFEDLNTTLTGIFTYARADVPVAAESGKIKLNIA